LQVIESYGIDVGRVEGGDDKVAALALALGFAKIGNESDTLRITLCGCQDTPQAIASPEITTDHTLVNKLHGLEGLSREVPGLASGG